METFVDFVQRAITELELDESSLRAGIEGGPKVFFVPDVAERIAQRLSELSNEQMAYMGSTWNAPEVQDRVRNMDPVTHKVMVCIALGLAWMAVSRSLTLLFGPPQNS